MKRLFTVLAIVLPVSSISYANDSVVEIGAGGLTYARTDAIEMLREDLYISLDEVRVDYQFRNFTDEDIETLVAFPMPDIGGTYRAYQNDAAPHPDVPNFLDFEVWVNSEAVATNHEERAIAAGIDVSDDLRALDVPLYPLNADAETALKQLPVEVLTDLVARGLIIVDAYDMGEGMQEHPVPAWTYRSTYWWRMTFPAGEVVHVSHRYTPAAGGTVGVTFVGPDGEKGFTFDEYETKYCIDDAFVNAVKRRLAAAGPERSPFWESWISYILTTGQNWFGNIREFHLTVDKGSPDNLVSFCAEGIEKTGPTTFAVTYTDFYPERDLNILLLQATSD